MGRAALRLEPIYNEKSRQITFKRKRDALFRKLEELTILCDVNASCIIVNPNSTSSTWPPAGSDEEAPAKLRRLIDAYETQNREPGRVKKYGLSDFFQDRKRRAEDELSRVKKRNRDAKYPTWFEPLDSWNGHELTQLDMMLRNKIESVQSRIEELRQGKEMKELSQSAAVVVDVNDNDHHHHQNQRLLENNGTMVMTPQISSDDVLITDNIAAANGGVGELGFGAVNGGNDDNGFFEDSEWGFVMNGAVAYEDWIECIENNNNK